MNAGSPEQTFPVYILAGGKSSRFGSDKARAELNGEALLSRIVRLLQPCARSFTVVADAADKYADLGVRTIADPVPGLGPMGGLCAALNDLSEPGWLLLCSCDMVALDCAWIEALAAARTRNSAAAAFKGERIEPLFALYHSLLLERVEEALAAGQFSPSRLLRAIPAAILPIPENWPVLAHVNTRAELDAAGLAERNDI